MTEFPDLALIASEAIAALGLGIVVMCIVEVVKYFGILPDGSAGTVAAVANISIFLLLTFVVKVFGFDLEGGLADQLFSIAKLIAELVLAILASLKTFAVLRQNGIYGFRTKHTKISYS